MWQYCRPDNHSHLHAISVEKFPLSKSDLIRALNAWPELKPLAEQLIQQYPLPLAGCHRLNFPEERFSLDLWLGDAHDVFPVMEKMHPVNAWFLDGFAPSCNPDMWQEQVLDNIVRLSDYGTTFASFSVAGVLKRGLKQHGIHITRPRGFGHKREMLKACWIKPETDPDHNAAPELAMETSQPNSTKQRQIAIIGAGVAGLSCAWAFAQRGHSVTLYDQTAPLAGGSGNPLALLNPKLCPIEQSHEHLMTLAWQHALHHYAAFQAFRPIQINQMALKNPEDLLSLANQYPEQVLGRSSAEDSLLETQFPSLNLLQAGVVSPHSLRDQILQHPRIRFQQATVKNFVTDHTVQVFDIQDQCLGDFDHVIVCCARQSQAFFEQYPPLKPIRGQVSWLNNPTQPLASEQAYSYGGYCMQLDPDHLILGASFYPNREDDEVLAEDHVHNFNLIHSVFPNYAQSLPPISTWQGRASVRAQTQDYFPVLGRLDESSEIYSLAGLGSKGFLFAPLCSEILAAQILSEVCPVPRHLLQKLHIQRFIKKPKAKKPYFKAQPHAQAKS
jgi:tRNA 5-methylaminomethyl-2-thiouridine biosynthesis bifunctional protein